MVSASGHAARFKEKAVRPMGRDTSGVRGMNVSAKGNKVLAVDVARDEDDLFVLTENGYGKRTLMSEYPVKGRGTKGVLTVKLTTKKGMLAGALVVRAHQELIFISQNGMVQRTSVSGISRMGRPTQGVRVMNLRSGDRVSAVALVVESAAGEGNGAAPVEEAIESEAAELPATDAAESDGAGSDGAEATIKPKPRAKPKAAPKKAAAKPKPKAKRTQSAATKTAAGSQPKANPPLASSRKRTKKR
jgi:DNA gyrase subunit A